MWTMNRIKKHMRISLSDNSDVSDWPVSKTSGTLTIASLPLSRTGVLFIASNGDTSLQQSTTGNNAPRGIQHVDVPIAVSRGNEHEYSRCVNQKGLKNSLPFYAQTIRAQNCPTKTLTHSFNHR